MTVKFQNDKSQQILHVRTRLECVCHLCWKVHWGIEGRYGVNPPTRKDTGSAQKKKPQPPTTKNRIFSIPSPIAITTTPKNRTPENPSSGKTQSSTIPDRPSPPTTLHQTTCPPSPAQPKPSSRASNPNPSNPNPNPSPPTPHATPTLIRPRPRLSHPMTYPPPKQNKNMTPRRPTDRESLSKTRFRHSDWLKGT